MSLKPARDQIEIFVDALLRHRGSEGYLSLRCFHQTTDKPLFSAMWRAPLGHGHNGFKAVVDAAYDMADRAANHAEPVVFCPPLAVFNAANGWQAREEDLLKGLALSVECDSRPEEARQKLQEILGEATAITRSGGQWINDDGVAEDKLHLHWRLKAPAMDGALAKLKRARELATRIVGGDRSNINTVHPIRWPGGWHRKAAPRLCEVVVVNPDIEIALDDALKALEEAAPDLGGAAAEPHEAGEPQASPDLVAAALAVIPNEEDWDGWNTTGMAVWRATGGASAGFAAFDAWSRKSPKYDSGNTAARWAGYFRSPPTHIGAGTIFHRADQASPNWRPPPEPEAEPPPNGNPTEATPAPLGEINAGIDFGHIRPREWLLGNQFCKSFISSLFAAGGVGKTSVRLLEYIAMATHRNLCGMHVFRRSKVLLISLEDNDEELRRRIKAVLLHYGIAQNELDGWLYFKSVVGERLVVRKGRFDRALGDLEWKIRDAINRLEPDLVGLDPFVKLHDLAENDSSDMDFVCSLLARIAVEKNISFDSPHHAHKGLIEPGDADAGRGSSGIRDAGRLIYTLTVMSSEEAQRFGIADDDRFAYVRLDPAKVNLSARRGAIAWFRLVSVPIGNATDMYPAGDTIQVAELWAPPAVWDGLDNATLNKILDGIDAGISDEDGTTSDLYSAAGAATDRAAWKVVQNLAQDKTEEQCRTIIREWLKSGLLVRETYYCSANRKNRTGLRVVASKRPGTVTEG